MPNVLHRNLTGADAVHPAAFVQSSDPGSVGANVQWIDTTTGPPYVLKLRNASNTAWLLFAAGIPGATGATGPTGATGLSGAPGSMVITGAATPYICIQDQKARNTSGGTFTSGAWQTRTLNTILANDQSLATLAANQITLPAGTWRCAISAPGYFCSTHQTRLQNITAGATILTGTSEWIQNGVQGQTRSVTAGRFALTSAQVVAVQHQCSVTIATNGFGVAANFGIEVYTIAEFWLEGPPPPFSGSTFDNPSLSVIQRRFVSPGQSHQHSLNTLPQ